MKIKKKIGGGGVGFDRKVGLWGVRVDVNGEVKFLFFWGVGVRSGVFDWGKGGSEQRIEVFVKIQKDFCFFGGWGVGSGDGVGFFFLGGGDTGLGCVGRVDVNEVLKFL